MIRRWHHGHSLGAGALAGLAVYSYAPYLLLAVGVLLGACGLAAAIGLYRLGRTLLGAWETWQANARAKGAAVPAGPRPVYSLRRSQNDDPPGGILG